MAKYVVGESELKQDIENNDGFRILWTPKDLRPGDLDKLRLWKEKNGAIIYDVHGSIEVYAGFDPTDWSKFYREDSENSKFTSSLVKKLRSGLDDNDDELKLTDRIVLATRLSRIARVVAKRTILYGKILELLESDDWSKQLEGDVRTRRFAYSYGLNDKIRIELRKVPDPNDNNLRYTLPSRTKIRIDDAADDIIRGFSQQVHSELINLMYDLDPAVIAGKRSEETKTALNKLRLVLHPHKV